MTDLTPILHHLPAWLMVLFRLSGMFLLTPVLGSGSIPMQVKALLVIGLSCCVYPTLLMDGAAVAALAPAMLGQMTIWSVGPTLAVELLLGYVLGYCVMLPLAGMQTGGHIIGQQMGLGIGGVYNPELEGEAGVVGQFLFLIGLLIFLVVGGHHAVFAVLVGSFGHVPLGGLSALSDFPPAAILNMILGLLAVMMELAVRIAAPLMCLLFLESVAMGFLARTVPQMNVLSIGFALRILITSVVLIALIGTIASVSQGVIVDSVRTVEAFVRAIGTLPQSLTPTSPAGGP